MNHIEDYIETKLKLKIEYNNANEKYKSIKWNNLNKIDVGKQVLFSKLIIPWLMVYNSEDEYEKCLMDYYITMLAPKPEIKYSYNSNTKIVENILYKHEFNFEGDTKKIICILYDILNIV